MSSGRKKKQRAAVRRSKGSQSGMGAGKYGNRKDLESGADFLAGTPWAGMDPDTEISVIISEGPEQPPGAGRHLGVLDRDLTDSRGQHFQAGWHLWSHDGQDRPGYTALSLGDADVPALAEALNPDARHAHEINMESARQGFAEGLAEYRHDPSVLAPVHRGRTGFSLRDWRGEVAQLQQQLSGQQDTRAFLEGHNSKPDEQDLIRDFLTQALEEISPGMAARAAAGMDETELKRHAPQIAAALQIAQEHAAQLVASDARARQLIAGSDTRKIVTDGPAARAVPVRTSWTADQVLDMQAWLAKFYVSGSTDLQDFLAHSMRNAQEVFEDPDMPDTMFWPLRLGSQPAGRALGQQYATILARGLRESRTYQVTAPMVDLMRETLAAEPPVSGIDGGEMPSHAGFCWLDKPWLMLEAAGYWMPFRAISWEKVSPLVQDDRGFTRAADAVRVVLWTLMADDELYGRWDSPKRADRAASAIGQLTPQHFLLLTFSHEYTVSEGYDQQGRDMLSLIHMLWRFLGMELSASRQEPSSAATAARVKKSLRHADVHIVTLRRTNYISDGPAGHRDVRYAVRWWVADFYRHLDQYDDGTDDHGRRRRHEAVPAARTGYVDDDDKHDICAVCLANDQTVRITPVRGHIRGPEHLPLKPDAHGRTVYKLSR